MKYRKWIRVCGWALAVLVLLFVDLFTKLLAQFYLALPEASYRPTYPFIPGFIEFHYSENPAIAFGIGAGNQAFMVFVTVLTFVMIIGIAVLSFTVFKKSLPSQITLAFIEAGAIGNLVDRLTLGIVRDFLDMSAFKPFAWIGSGLPELANFNFGICNVADYFITVGAVALIFIILFIGPMALFPLKKSWREEAKRREEEQEAKKHAKG